jgi:hypothetical protein
MATMLGWAPDPYLKHYDWGGGGSGGWGCGRIASNRVVYQYDVGGRGGEEEMEAIPGFILYDVDVCIGGDERRGGVQSFQISNAGI